MKSIGTALGCLHDTTIIHGDLTTSNMMIRLTPGSAAPYEIVRVSLMIPLSILTIHDISFL